MQITGMLYGSKLLEHVEFPTSEVLGPGASEDEIQALIDRHKLIFIKPLFKGGVGTKGKSGLIGKARDLKTALGSQLFSCPPFSCQPSAKLRMAGLPGCLLTFAAANHTISHS